MIDARGGHNPTLQPFRALRHDRREFVFGFARIDAAAKQAVAHSVEEINQQSDREPGNKPDPGFDEEAEHQARAHYDAGDRD